MARAKTKRFGSITIAALAGGAFDLTTGALLPGAESLTVPAGPGDFTWSNPNGAIEAATNRGSLTDAVLYRVDDAPITASLSTYVEEFTSAVAAVIADVCNVPDGYVAANWTSVTASAPGCDPDLLVDIRYTLAGSGYCENDQIEILQKCKLLCDFSEGLPNTRTINISSFADEIVKI